jgi:hypothetical protein
LSSPGTVEVADLRAAQLSTCDAAGVSGPVDVVSGTVTDRQAF